MPTEITSTTAALIRRVKQLELELERERAKRDEAREAARYLWKRTGYRGWFFSMEKRT